MQLISSAMVTRFLICFTVAIFSSAHALAFHRCDNNAELGYTGNAKIPPDQNLGFDEFAKIARRERNVENTLKFLKANNGEYLQFHTLMYCSPSIQAGTFREPRAIVFGPKADFIFSFNGGFHQGGGNAFETATQHPLTKKWEFREVAYKKSGEVWDDSIQANEIDATRSAPSYIRVSKPNPQKCMQCHSVDGINARPNWNDYFLWPCAYGSHDDILSQQFDRNMEGQYGNMQTGHVLGANATKPVSQSRLFKLKNGSVDREMDGALAYIAAKDSSDRYQYLPDRPADGPLRKLSAGQSFQSIRDDAEFAKAKERLGNSEFPASPNFYFTQKVAERNRESIIAQLVALPGIYNLIPSLLFMENCSYAQDSGLPLGRPMSPQVLLSQSVSPEEFQGIQKKVGSIDAYERDFLMKELDMQTSRIYQMEATFGRGSFQIGSLYSGGESNSENYWVGSNLKFYQEKLGRSNFSQQEKIAMNMERTSPGNLIAAGYLLKAYGLDIHSLSMAFNQGSRTAAFQSGQLSCLSRDVFKKVRGNADLSCEQLRALISKNTAPVEPGVSEPALGTEQ